MSSELQKICDYVCELLLEESNVQPVSTPVTVCGDIHGQVTHRFWLRLPFLWAMRVFVENRSLPNLFGALPCSLNINIVWPKV